MGDFQAIAEEGVEQNEAIGVGIQVEETDEFADFIYG